jgi:peroxiredoxin
VLNVEVGEAVPVHPLPDLEGKARSVADYRGKKLVLLIFASW